MVARRRKPKIKKIKKIKFELTKTTIVGIGIIIFCLFLWMFLLGVWTGQSLLVPFQLEKKIVTVKPV